MDIINYETLTSLCLARWSGLTLCTEIASWWPHLAPAGGWFDELGRTSCTACFKNIPRWDSTFQFLQGDLLVFSPVATFWNYLAVSCQLSCSAAFSSWCTSFNPLFFPRGVGILLTQLFPGLDLCNLISASVLSYSIYHSTYQDLG